MTSACRSGVCDGFFREGSGIWIGGRREDLQLVIEEWMWMDRGGIGALASGASTPYVCP